MSAVVVYERVDGTWRLRGLSHEYAYYRHGEQ